MQSCIQDQLLVDHCCLVGWILYQLYVSMTTTGCKVLPRMQLVVIYLWACIGRFFPALYSPSGLCEYAECVCGGVVFDVWKMREKDDAHQQGGPFLFFKSFKIRPCRRRMHNNWIIFCCFKYIFFWFACVLFCITYKCMESRLDSCYPL